MRLERSIKSSLPAFLQQHAVDLLVCGDEWPQAALQLTSVSDWVQQHIACPFVIIRRHAVVNARMRIGGSQASLSSVAAAATAGAGEVGGDAAAAAAAAAMDLNLR